MCICLLWIISKDEYLHILMTLYYQIRFFQITLHKSLAILHLPRCREGKYLSIFDICLISFYVLSENKYNHHFKKTRH